MNGMRYHFHELYFFYDLPGDLQTIRQDSRVVLFFLGIAQLKPSLHIGSGICVPIPFQPSNTRGAPFKGVEKEKNEMK